MKRVVVRWPGASIHTIQSLQRTSRQLSQRSAGAARVLSEMKKGASLHCSHEPRVVWKLSTGIFVAPEVAAVVIASDDVIASNDGLLPDHHQTWKHRSINND